MAQSKYAPQRKSISVTPPKYIRTMDTSINSFNNHVSFPTPELTYHGGRILSAPVFSNVYIGDYWRTTRGAQDRQYLDKFSKDILGSPYTRVWKEYGVKRAKVGTSTSLTLSPTKKAFTELDIQRSIFNGLQSGSIKRTSEQDVFTLFLPPGMVLLSPDGYSSREGLGGYHSSFDSKQFGRIYYAVVVYGSTGNGIPFSANPRDNITVTASHEWTEAATDPDVNNGELGWYDANYGEVSDIIMDMGGPLSQAYGSVNGYKVQKNWSNRDQRFEVRPLALHPKAL
ncbi:MAG: hypothetical protein K1X79_03360 [Oligoflexia bacterium]|nr:hypothetical protein [Oligoflexia bacterium]